MVYLRVMLEDLQIRRMTKRENNDMKRNMAVERSEARKRSRVGGGEWRR